MKHLLSVSQFRREHLERLFHRGEEHTRMVTNERRHNQIGNILSGEVLYRLFYEPSTRTYESFGFAGTHLGMAVLGTQTVEFSSVAKGETLEDTIRTICSYYPSLIVLRHNETGGAKRAAKVSSVPIINAGDGRGEHPTQTLTDLFTIQRLLGRIDRFTLVIGGDLANGRTTNSLALAVARLCDRVKIIGVSAPEFRMRAAIKRRLADYGCSYTETTSLRTALRRADVVYWTRTQKERLTKGQQAHNPYVIDLPQLELMKPSAILMHPLPRVGEITTAVDADPRAVYLTHQMRNGMFVRMAVMEDLLGRPI